MSFVSYRCNVFWASVKFRIGSPKTARNGQVCAHQSPTGLWCAQTCSFYILRLYLLTYLLNYLPTKSIVVHPPPSEFFLYLVTYL